MSEAAQLIGAANVALIVPVANDTESLSSLLAQIGAWDSRPREIIVAAADRDRALEALCRREGCRLLLTRANRGAQLDHGARAANAAVMWFVHADAALPQNGLDAIAAALAAGADGGCFRFTFQGRPKWYKTLLAALIAVRIRCGGMVYGDQGLFVRREAYEAAGGFPHQPLFEEVRLVKALRRRGKFRVLPAPIGISTRRWERDGWCRRSLRNRCLALCYMLGVPAERLSRAYHGAMDAPRETEP
jgi:rSAM/selenodomain-associated transferase 2